MAHCWGWPKALSTGAEPLDAEAVALFAAGDYVIACYTASLQVWSGGQHRLKLGELHRSQEQLEEEGPNLRAHWCPQKRVLAVATAHNHLQLYTLNVSSEALWRLPGGGDVRRVNLYLSHSLHLDYGPVRIADLGGDAKSLLVALSNGTMQVFSWQGKLRGQANPFIAAYEGSRSRRGASRLSSGSLGPRSSLSADGGAANGLGLQPGARLAGSEASTAGTAGTAGAGAAAGSAAPSPMPSDDAEPPSSGLLAALAALDLPQPTPAQPAEVVVSRIHYCPAARMLAVVLADGRCALCRTSEAGIHPVEQLQLFRWAYKPAGPAAPAVVAAALHPTAQLLALGLSHGRVAIYTLQSLLSSRPQHQHLRSSGSSGSLRLPERADSALPPAASTGPGQPEPARLLSLADWGYRSSVVGPAQVLQWAPDGRVLAVGYGRRGMAVWTPSGCRLMCTLRQAVATAAPGATSLAGATSPTRSEPGSAADQQQQAHRSSTESARGGSPGQRPASAGPGGLWSQNSSLNPGQALEPGVLEGGISAMVWTVHGYQLLVAEHGRAATLHQLEFARQVHGAHRVVQPWAAAGGGDAAPSGHAGELHALQAADRILLITEARQAPNPALRLPTAAAASGGEQSDAEAAGARPDLVLQHVKLPQHYIDAAYPLLHAAISQDRADVAVAGTRGLAIYSRRARRWRLFGDATQERGLRVQGLMWLPGGVIAAVAYVDGKAGAAAPQLLLYPQYHLDNASLLARLPLKQVPVAMDSAGWHLALAFHPLEIKLFKVTVEGPLGPAGRPIARLSVLRELSIMGMGSPLQELALIDPTTLPRPDSSGAGSSQSSLVQQAQQAEEQQTVGGAAAAAGEAAVSDPSWPQLKVATKPATPAAGAGDAPLQCVLLRAGGIMSKLDLTEGSEVLLSDAIERFWLPLSSASATVGMVSRSSSFVAAAGVGPGAQGTVPPSLSTSSSLAALGPQSSEAELPAASAAAPAAARQQAAAAAADELGPAAEQQGPRLPPRVEMPWWTYGARGMQLWFPSSLSEPLTPSRSFSLASPLAIASPTATGLAAAAAAAATNSTDPELEFDREVYPVGVSLAEVSIVGVMQRTVRSQAFAPDAAQSLCFHPLPESQPVLPCLLRRLLQKGRHDDALELARWHSSGPHFNRSLEWLLFTALELDAEQQPSSSSAAAANRPRFNSSYAVTLNSMQAGGAVPGGIASPRRADALPAGAPPQRRAGPLLVAAARLISQFPQFPEIVVSVARKTDAALWPALFSAVGSPGQLCQGLMQADKLQSAACCLVIVEQIEGSTPAQELALQLIEAALAGGQYGLAADLLRFLVPPGEAGEALLELPGEEAAPQDAAAAAAAHPASPLRARQQDASAAAGVAEAGAAQQQQEQQQQEQQQQSGSWFWGLFGVGGSEPQAPAPANGSQQAEAAAPAAVEPQQAAAPARSSQERSRPVEESMAAGRAWRLAGEHAWRMLDAGALREAAQLARSLSGLHGGLPALLAATASETPAARAQLVPSAAAIASALFVAANEFAAEQEGDAALSAELLLAVSTEAGCTNLAAALALLLGDQASLQSFAGQHPAVWADLYGLLANDVHLCGYAPVLSPLPSPVVGAGGLTAGALLAA